MEGRERVKQVRRQLIMGEACEEIIGARKSN